MAKEKQDTHEQTDENQPVRPDPSIWKRDRVIMAGLSGASFVAIIQLLSLPTLSASLKIALYSFIIAIPLLVAFIFITESKILNEWIIKSFEIKSLILGTIGAVFAYLGLTAILWHFSFIAGLLFIVISIIAAIIVKWFTPRLEQLANEARKQEEKTKNN